MGAIQVKTSSTQGTRSRLARSQPRAGTVVLGEFTPRPRASSSNGRTLDSPEAQLGQASLWSNLGQIASPTDRIAGAFNAKDRLTPYPDTRASVGKVEVTAVTSPFHWPTWQENSATRPAPTAVPPTRMRLTTAKFSLRRNRKLRLARPWASASGGGLRLARPQGSASTLASEGGLRLARPRGSASTSASEGGLRLAP
jgi:hypothetical protein